MKNTKGEIFVMVCVFVLIVVTAFSVIFTYASTVSIAKIQKKNSEIVFDSFVAKNSIVIYNNIKQGKNAVRNVDTSAYLSSLISFCTLDEKNGMLYSMNEDMSEKFHITKPQIGFIEDGKLELFATYTLFIPIRFGGVEVTTATIPIRISSELTSKN